MAHDLPSIILTKQCVGLNKNAGLGSALVPAWICRYDSLLFLVQH